MITKFDGILDSAVDCGTSVKICCLHPTIRVQQVLPNSQLEVGDQFYRKWMKQTIILYTCNVWIIWIDQAISKSFSPRSVAEWLSNCSEELEPTVCGERLFQWLEQKIFCTSKVPSDSMAMHRVDKSSILIENWVINILHMRIVSTYNNPPSEENNFKLFSLTT